MYISPRVPHIDNVQGGRVLRAVHVVHNSRVDPRGRGELEAYPNSFSLGLLCSQMHTEVFAAILTCCMTHICTMKVSASDVTPGNVLGRLKLGTARLP